METGCPDQLPDLMGQHRSEVAWNGCMLVDDRRCIDAACCLDSMDRRRRTHPDGHCDFLSCYLKGMLVPCGVRLAIEGSGLEVPAKSWSQALRLSQVLAVQRQG